MCSWFSSAYSKMLGEHEGGSRFGELLNCCAMAFPLFPSSQLIPTQVRPRNRI